jgi:demethylmenaquinone methyltransferase/2-methoxy-6-polyprenyl-1,4-benzoquinol methylase
MAIEAAQLNPKQIIGVDISEKMLAIGRSKVSLKDLDNIITLESGKAENLRFETGSFDAVMAAFGVRNFEHLEQGLAEFYRVLCNDGVALILEFSRPRWFPVKQLYRFYSRQILPLFGGIISNNRSAYEYLPNTVAEFPDGEEFCTILRSIGFTSITWYPQTFGITSIYIAKKQKVQ